MFGVSKKISDQKDTSKLITIFSLVTITGISLTVFGNVYENQKIYDTKNFSEFFQKLDINYVSNVIRTS